MREHYHTKIELLSNPTNKERAQLLCHLGGCEMSTGIMINVPQNNRGMYTIKWYNKPQNNYMDVRFESTCQNLIMKNYRPDWRTR